jgi:hypothetical protein
MTSPLPILAFSVVALLWTALPAVAAKVTVRLTGGEGVVLVGAMHRWDQDGNALKPTNKDAIIDKPEAEAKAARAADGTWVFRDLAPGRYDLVLLGEKRLRIEGFEYAPVLEFDPFIPGTATCDEESREFIEKDIRKSEHYENKVQPLYLGGDKKVIRVLVQLIRDKPTSYTPGAGTMRHEIWQYTFNYGGWVKERRTRVLDRHLLQVSELRQWTWIWEPKLGGIEVKKKPIKIQYEVPREPDPKTLKGLYPY